MLRQATHRLEIATQGKSLVAFTDATRAFVHDQRFVTGLLTIFCRHTSASLLIQENADPDVCRDILAFFEKLVPEGATDYSHRTEGPDDMPAHIRTALTMTQLSIPVVGGQLALGVWQGLYLFEHRSGPHRREIVLHLLGERE